MNKKGVTSREVKTKLHPGMMAEGKHAGVTETNKLFYDLSVLLVQETEKEGLEGFERMVRIYDYLRIITLSCFKTFSEEIYSRIERESHAEIDMKSYIKDLYDGLREMKDVWRSESRYIKEAIKDLMKQ